MSHFSLAVLHKEEQCIDELLAPYSEELETAPRLKYTKAEAIRYARENYEECRNRSDEECWEFIADGYTTDEDGNIYTTYNPQSKWDWYEVGGRWDGYLSVNGEHVNTAHVGEIDFSPDEETYKKSLRYWDVVVGHAPAETPEEGFSLYNEKYYLDYYGDRETFARRQSAFMTHAVITPDGVWHEQGQMGWFGLSSETPDESADWAEHYLERFIKNADPKLMMTIVDCHI